MKSAQHFTCACVWRKMEDKLLKSLYDEQVITQRQYYQTLEKCAKSETSSDVALVELGILSEEAILDVLGDKFRMPVVNWEAYHPDSDVLSIVSEQTAKKYAVFPYAMERGKRQNKITLALSSDSNVSAIDDIAFMTGCIVKTEITTASSIQRAIQTYYHQSESVQPTDLPRETRVSRDFDFSCGIAEFDALLPELDGLSESEESVDPFATLDRDHPSTKLLLELLEVAVERGVTEIHLDPHGQEHHIRFCLHGALLQHSVIPEQIGHGIALRLRRVLQRFEVASKKETSLFQGGAFTLSIQHKYVKVLVKFFPSVFGEKVLLKIKEKTLCAKLNDLTLNDGSLKILERILGKPQGILLLISPPRHGKTTTLYAILQHLARSEKIVASLEPNIEMNLEKVYQLPCSPQVSYQQWASLFAYQAPDVLGLDNVERPLLEQLVCQFAASTFMPVAWTASDCADGLCSFIGNVFETLQSPIQEGIPLLLDAISGVLSQRLIRTICPHCKEKITLSKQEHLFLEAFAADNGGEMPETLYAGKGCHECFDSGYAGQTGLFTVMKPDKGLKQFILQSTTPSSFQVREFLAEMMAATDTSNQQALYKLQQGITSPAEIRRALLQ